MIYYWLMFIVAVAPAVYLMLKMYRMDVIEPEPPQLLRKLFIGGCLSVVPAIILETIGFAAAEFLIPSDSIMLPLVESMICVALVEEGCKYFYLKKNSWRDRAFNYSFDGIVYATFTSLGFALVENVKYVFNHGLGVGVQRAFLAVPMHACCGVYMGISYGQAKACEAAGDIKGMRRHLHRSLWLPVLLHGVYDFCLFVSSALSMLVFWIFVAALFVHTLKTICKMSAVNTYIPPQDNDQYRDFSPDDNGPFPNGF